MITYGLALLLKHTKIKPIPVAVSILIVFVTSVYGMIFNDGNVARLANNILLISIMMIVHLFIYYKEYQGKPNIEKKYNLSKDQLKAINLLISGELNTTDIADKMCVSKSTVDNYFSCIFTKLDIPKGGNRKAGLILKLAQEGFI